MKRYGSFLIRCWLIDDSAHDERAVIDVEHIQTGCRTRAAGLAETESWMLEACRAVRAHAEEAPEAERERDRP